VTSPAILIDISVVTIYSVIVLMLGIILYGKYGKT